jgi:hypothetical protein
MRGRKEVPRWKRRRSVPAAPPRMNRRHARAYAREHAREYARLTSQPADASGTVIRSGAWRFRRHTAPFLWLALVLAAAQGLRSAAHPVLFAILGSGAFAAAIVWATRHLSPFARRMTDVAAMVTTVWLPVLVAAGFGRPVPALLALTWALFAAAWVRHYRWRPQAPDVPASPAAAAGDEATWERLARKQKWSGHLEAREDIPGGRIWDIVLDGVETHIGQVMAQPRAIAAAWGKSQTEAYAEPHRAGLEDRGRLTILKAGTLEEVRDWDGEGFSEDGIARIGRFADGAPARIRCWVPMDGTRHSLIAGASGSGKSALLDLLVWLALMSPVPVVPVILDPQNGQSLPQWRGKVLYAAGLDECVRMERALSAGMLDRSRRLASMTWDDNGHTVRGMEFFDARLSGLPVVMVITDEAPYLLTGGGNAKLAAEMVYLLAGRAKLGRKAGDSEQLVAQVPSLGELGDQALRAQLVGGNVVGLRTGEKVSAGMLGLQADPSVLPKYFPSGEPTGGIGYVVSLDNRQAPFRTDRVPRTARHQAVSVPVLEDGFLEAMDGAMGGVSPSSAYPVPPQPSAPPEPEPDTAEGRRCIDAVWQVLADRAQPMERGEIIKWVTDLAKSWDRKPWSIRSVTDALGKLVSGADGRAVTKIREGVYQAVAADTSDRSTP